MSDVEDQLLKISQGFQNAQSIKDLNNLVSQIDATTSNIDKTLNYKVMIELRKLQHELSGIELNRAKLTLTTQISSQLSTLFSLANDLGHTLTYKIKTLDLEINKVQETLEFVENIQLLKNNINQAFYALDHQDWTTAAKCIHTINTEVEPKLLIDGEFASVVIPSTDIPELPGVTLQNWKNQLATKFQEFFNAAADKRDIPELTKYFQLFPLINYEEIGLICYSKFICLIISDTLRSLIGSLSGTKQQEMTGVYSTISMKLFESISMMLSQHGTLIKKYYGPSYPNALKFVISKIQGEVDSQIGIISDTFYDFKRIDKVIQDIKLYQFPLLTRRLEDDNQQHQQQQQQQQQQQNQYHNQNQTQQFQNGNGDVYYDQEIVTIVSVGDLIGELASILHYWVLYCKFITVKYIQPLQKADDGLQLPLLIVNSNFTNKVQQKLLPSFEILYCYYFRRSLEKAISIEELPSLDSYLISTQVSTSPDQPPVSSVIEDTTLVLNTCLRSVIDTSQLQTVKHFVTESYKIIHRDLLIGYFMKNLRENQPRYNSMLHLVQPVSISQLNSPGSTRSNTPVPEVGGTVGGVLRGATSALGSVVASTAAATTTKEQSPKLINFVLLLNTLAMGQEYFTKIIENLLPNSASDFLAQQFPFSNDQHKVEQILTTEFLQPFTNSSNKLIQENLIVLYNQSIKNNMARLVNEFLPETSSSFYLIYSSSTLNDTSTMLKISQTWQTVIRPYKQTFHKSLVFNKLLRLLVINLANLIEKKLLVVLEKFKINELGALKLEKDLSFFINEICEDNYDLREKFIRVTQLVLLVGMDEEEYELANIPSATTSNDVDDEDDDDFIGINWVLTPLERKRARQFRI